MIPCPSCQTDVAEHEVYCGHCGARLDGDSESPLLPSDERDSGGHVEPTDRLSQTQPYLAEDGDEPRFIPGTILLDRYRVVALIGRGAMGEIYRAEDLKLHEPVALKFLPESVASDGATLARLYREVRIAHQISHPNVCRVFDLGEVDSQHFISMEYIDGENLASLLRRIGHPPHAKALQIAQQICLGVAAAHARGVLHRDIKPANVMIDGRGQAKITDFGLAGLIEELGGREVRAGTPAYMAPEQIHGLAVSIRSDIYALGLVFYELFTGHKAFRNNQRGALRRPSTIVDGLDPAVERTLLRCLKTNPDERPASVREVAALLPGGDPLAAALAAGEIPSPEMVASAPREGSLRPPVAVACLSGLIVLIVLLALFSKGTMLHLRAPFDKPPEVLSERARDVLLGLGLPQPPHDAYGFRFDASVARYLEEHDAGPDRWSLLEGGRASVILFWYRSNPQPVTATAAGYWRIDLDDPPLTLPGMSRVILDPTGRLIAFRTVLPHLEKGPPPAAESTAPEIDWSLLFKAAEFDLGAFQPTAPQWIPPLYGDRRWAWRGVSADLPEVELRVEAATFRRQVVFFQVAAPWTRPLPAWTKPMAPDSKIYRQAFQVLFLVVMSIVIVMSAVLAWHNLRGGRGDRKGAFRLALTLFGTSVISWIFRASHVPSFAEFLLFMQAMAMACFRSIFLWIVYLALEPFVRQYWPERIISWSRFLAGRWRDPLMGRDLLIGALLGLGMLLFQVTGAWAPTWFDQPLDPLDVTMVDTDPLLGLPGVLRQINEHIYFGPLVGLGFLFVLLLLHMALGRQGWATGSFWLLLTSALVLGSPAALPGRVALALSAALMLFVLQRFGLLAVAAAIVFYMTFRFFPITADLGAWYSNMTILAVLLVLVPASYGFYRSLAGQEVLRPDLLEDRVSSASGI